MLEPTPEVIKALRARCKARMKGKLPPLWTAAPIGKNPDPKRHEGAPHTKGKKRPKI